MSLTAEQRKRGQENFNTALVSTRRDFLKAAVAVPAVGAFYFGYRQFEGDPVRAAIIGTGGEGRVLVRESTPEYLRYVAYSDIRPSNQRKAQETFREKYGSDADDIRLYEDYRELLEDDSIEMVVIALPLHMHALATIDALAAGKHVFCEKLMARNVADSKRMVQAADEAGRLLAIGHQRHYSALYDNALHLVGTGILGDVKHIRALWHRNQTWPRLDDDGKPMVDSDGNPVLRDSWKPTIPDEDRNVDFTKHGYTSLEELVRWRLFRRTSGGLMAELGSHQLDACSLFLGKVRPLAVSGVGGKYFFQDNREVNDHIYVTYEFPDGVTVTYSSICTNAFEPYGETIMGTRGTLVVEQEHDVMLFKERNPNKPEDSPKAMTVEVASTGDGVALDSSASLSPPAEAAIAQLATGQISRGYREELEHFAYCVRNPSDENKPRCDGRVALADAVMALAANEAMRRRERIEFQDAWFDPYAPDVPEQETEEA